MKYYNQIKDLLIALFLIGMLTDFISHIIFALTIALLIFSLDFKKLLPERNEIPIIIFIFVTYLNMSIQHERFLFPNQITSLGIVFMYLTMKIGKNLPVNSFKLITIFALIEALYLIFSFNTNIVFHLLNSNIHFNEITGIYIYHNRTIGLMASPALSGLLLLVGLISLQYLKQKFSVINLFIFYTIFTLGILISMSRAAQISMILFYSILCSLHLMKYFKKHIYKKTLVLLILLITMISSILFSFIFYNFDFQNLRISASGRFDLFYNCIEFIQNNIFFGNGSWRYLDSSFAIPPIHSHNSYLQLFATHGLLSILLIYFIFNNLTFNKFIILSPILIFNFFNFSLFYNVSMGDIIFYSILLNKELDNFTKVDTPLFNNS